MPTCSKRASGPVSALAAHQQLIRVHGDSLRRAAETESAIWQVEVVNPALAAGKRPDEILGIDFGDRMSVLTERAVLAMYHLQQARAWTTGIIEGLEIDPRRGRSAQPARASSGDVLPRHQRLHAPHPGAGRRGGGASSRRSWDGSSSGRRSSTAAGP